MTEEPYAVPMPRVRRGCKKCRVTEAEIKSGYVVVGPNGTAHHGDEGGQTACHIDTTGINYRRWWWPL